MAASRPVAGVLDLDGVIWLADQPLPGAADAVARLRAAGERVLFVTNNSFAPLGDQEAKLERFGIPAHGDVVTSAMAGATLVEPGERVLVCGGPGIVEAVSARGAEPVRDGDADVVAVGFHRDFDYERLRVAMQAIRRGARLVATNDDATYPSVSALSSNVRRATIGRLEASRTASIASTTSSRS